MLKDCWDGSKEEIRLSQISSEDFLVVADWIYSGKLPKEITESGGQSKEPYWELTLRAHKVADTLMMTGLQNKLVTAEAAHLVKDNFAWNLRRLKQLHEYDLCHTKYYNFVIKSTTMNLVDHLNTSLELWNDELDSVKDIPSILADMLTSTREWLRKPWKDFPEGDLTDFLVEEVEEQLVLPA